MDKKEQIEALLARPLPARLATTSLRTLQPHLTIVWFAWDGQHAWISSFTSTRKVKDLRSNPQAALLVEPEAPGSGLQAVLLEGPVELVEQPRAFVQEMAARIYTHYLGPDGVQAPDPQSWIVDPENLIVKLTPGRIFSW